MAITHVQLLSIPVTDQDKAKAFYIDVLGFRLVRENHMGPAQRWVQVAPQGGQTSVTLVTWFETMPPGSLKGLVLETDDVDGDAAAIAERGGEVSEISDMPWGRYFTVHDPDGNGIVIQRTTMA
jgi:predicted enzyme related to lactoylglutathione lyase